MKRILSVLVIFALLFSLCACNKKSDSQKETNPQTATEPSSPAAAGSDPAGSGSDTTVPKDSENAETSAPDEDPQSPETTLPAEVIENPAALLYGSWYAVNYLEEFAILTEYGYLFNEDGTCSSGGNDWVESMSSTDFKAYNKFWELVGGGGDDYTYTYDGTTLTLYIQSSTGNISADDLGQPQTYKVTVKGDEMYVYYDEGYDVYYRGEMDWDSTNTTP